VISSDHHFHSWSQFATIGADGVNSRLQVLLNELIRSGEELAAAGGRRIYLAGDLYHVRGSVSPLVQNPVIDTFKALTQRFDISGIPGNHDLEGAETTRLGSACEALCTVGVRMANETWVDERGVVMIPWYSHVKDLLAEIDRVSAEIGDPSKYDLIIHAPVDGVLIGIPTHGLTAEMLARSRFKRIFAGHYHHHASFDDRVFSIGALAHHTWSDVGSKAGYLLVEDDKVTWRASHAPKFVDITAETPEEEIPLLVDGNYVRVKVSSATEAEVRKIREDFTELGAQGVIIHAIRDTKLVARSGSTVKVGASIETSVYEFIKARKVEGIEAQMIASAEEVLSEARNAA
jgi:DNA repair exonuclease SbcCD nuclease subunit